MWLLVFCSQNALLPAGLRQKDQTSKTASGPFNRERLLKYLEKEAMEYKDRDDIVPFTGEKKGALFFLFFVFSRQCDQLITNNTGNKVLLYVSAVLLRGWRFRVHLQT